MKCVQTLPMAGESRATHLTLASEDENPRLCNASVPEKQILPNAGSALETGKSDSKDCFSWHLIMSKLMRAC